MKFNVHLNEAIIKSGNDRSQEFTYPWNCDIHFIHEIETLEYKWNHKI